MGSEKRKRQDELVNRPKKKSSTGPPTGNIKVQFVQNSDVLGPVLATTPGLNCPRDIAFKPYKSSKILPGSATQELLLQSSAHPRLDYTASEEKDGSSDSMLTDYIGVYDPVTQKLQLVQVPKLTVRSTLRSEVEEVREEEAKARMTMAQKKYNLTAEFGSKKSKKAIQERMANRIARGDPNEPTEENPVADAIMQGMDATNGKMPTKEELEAELDSSKPRPKANLAAEYPADVYPIDTIVGKELMALIPIKDWLDSAEEGKGVQVASKYVARRILKLAKNKDVQKLKVLKFILLCVNFNAALRTKGKGPKNVPPKDKLITAMGDDIPPAVVDSIRRKFVSAQNDMPRWNIDNLMTHTAAAALIVDGFEVDVNDLRDDLKIENKDIKAYFQEIGCKVNPPTQTEQQKLKISKAEGINHSIAKLRIPLSFPRISKGRSNQPRR
ncbi:RNA polymerase I associated factor, A49-like protein [Aaosphaeria arxii CBS 175.79]|uniref:RNA polymerase I associated factor, A49-like protein n=1 Tax=Aaosphaeria arxii CBS 175.79 TaxID=1450172 RepID=A0A6A5XHW5_9PLEO|nr:RNA polymerase I associated factor, A49-like protein [Aaosphaeria arxii CBS 175.79]KAF2012469.1 RNA polymerase I associated factor, A49-like protein [Aaosphaeria arxii CBS 175.79]